MEKRRDAFANVAGRAAPIGAGVGGRLMLLRRAFREAGTTRVLHVRRLGSVPIALRTLV